METENTELLSTFPRRSHSSTNAYMKSGSIFVNKSNMVEGGFGMHIAILQKPIAIWTVSGIVVPFIGYFTNSSFKVKHSIYTSKEILHNCSFQFAGLVVVVNVVDFVCL
ncbi:hypothetical protein GQX74_009972 [Glossina fuscipes]|nr:hypothetical protein GQX74_009972 [Glossina fuscipes]